MEAKICIQCKKLFWKPKYGQKGYAGLARWKNRKCCSVQCSRIAFPPPKRGRKVERICKFCEESFWIGKGDLKWHKYLYCSKLCMGNAKAGKNHWNWKGGISEPNKKIRHSRKYTEWRNAVYKRDRWKCTDCKKKCRKGNIIAHHPKSFNDFPDLRFDVNNGITLCRSCHKIRHREIGMKTRFK